MLHVLRDCPVARDIWNKLIPVGKQTRFYSKSLHEWMTGNLQNKLSIGSSKIDWPCLFGMISWHTWKNQNNFAFQDITWSTKEIIKLNLTLNRGFECILIQTNSFEAINDIQKEALKGSKSTLIRRIHQLLSKVHHWSIQHIPRDENKI
ncbi:hypothetical protein Gotur_012433, partial [Gossypium turneri]